MIKGVQKQFETGLGRVFFSFIFLGSAIFASSAFADAERSQEIKRRLGLENCKPSPAVLASTKKSLKRLKARTDAYQDSFSLYTSLTQRAAGILGDGYGGWRPFYYNEEHALLVSLRKDQLSASGIILEFKSICDHTLTLAQTQLSPTTTAVSEQHRGVFAPLEHQTYRRIRHEKALSLRLMSRPAAPGAEAPVALQVLKWNFWDHVNGKEGLPEPHEVEFFDNFELIPLKLED